ncbi:DUF6390 family protein [Paractinoplanes rishiriensis]|uniref:Uncharacterized protein n=1 Tax=Paractinoplanes rishiriensis TaxID=1050105 RepID=A0A919N2K3_9ACTN|nr:DUF6390 family protein [Actinoplanes rishiriensis]GIF00583.1 hypothetical protein Ari01nite_80470 [Actinoplanes rishiriensis]
MSAAGALLFARYAYPPNELGYCGPAGAGVLLDGSEGEIARRARGFEGAWAYLEFLAGVAGTADPLDEEVVEAYWIGNALLDQAEPAELTGFIRQRFAGQVGGTWVDADSRAVAHHSFHVFEVYPWAVLLHRTGNPAAVSVLDRCRIRTGVVREVGESTATVTARPLVWREGRLAAGPSAVERVTWSVGGRSLLAGLHVGDQVALHWDWVCDVLTADQVRKIIAYEERQLTLIAEKMS